MVEDYRGSSDARVVITDADGIAVVSTDEESIAGQDYSTRPEIATALGGEPISGERRSDSLDTNLVYVAVPMFVRDDVVGTVRITYPTGVVERRVDDRVRGLAVVGDHDDRPGHARRVRRVGHRHPAAAPPAPRHRAAGRRRPRHAGAGRPAARRRSAAWPRSFNRMSERTQRLVDEQRSFAGDASHQLRTPLTALRLRLEQAADLMDSDPAGARERLESATAETERLQHVIDGLLTLARAAGDGKTEVVDVSAVVHDRVDLWQPLAEESDVTVTVDVPPTAPAVAVVGGLDQIVDNLVDNALGAAPPHSSVDITVVNVDGSVVTTIADRGPGMTADQIARSFDRFWRAPDAADEGTGLGLAVVQHLTVASGGDVSLAARDGGGLVAIVRLRRADGEPVRT